MAKLQLTRNLVKSADAEALKPKKIFAFKTVFKTVKWTPCHHTPLQQKRMQPTFHAMG